VKRNLERWTAQYEASKTTDEMSTMDKLTSWLHDHIPPDNKSTLIHGDYRSVTQCFQFIEKLID